MKCLFLSAKRYSINKSITKGLICNNIEVKIVDYEDYFPDFINNFIRKYESLPNKVKNLWKYKYVESINRKYIEDFLSYQPDIVFIYNNQNILPATLIRFKTTSKIVFMLGDNPLYTPTNPYNLHILFSADYIISPDSFWSYQLKKLGINNIFFDCFSFDPDLYYQSYIEESDLLKYQSEIVYIGTAHKHNWGYKRFLFLDYFKEFNLRAYISGDGYDQRWKELFPDLASNIIPHNEFNQKFNNIVYNCSKISPVEQVPSLFNGIHVRIFDILGSGIFPLCEHCVDLDTVFKGLNIPFIRSYYEIPNIVRQLLSNDFIRNEMVQEMRDLVLKNFAPEKVIQRIIERI